MTFEMATARSIHLCAWLVGSLTLAWLVVHAFLRFAWTRPVPRGRSHRQSAVRSLAHAAAAVGILLLAIVSMYVALSLWRVPELAVATILPILYTPLLAWILAL